MQNSFITNTDYADNHDNMKNNTINDYANYAGLQHWIRNNFITDYADFRVYIKSKFDFTSDNPKLKLTKLNKI